MRLQEVTNHVALNAQGFCGVGADFSDLQVHRLHEHNPPMQRIQL